MENIRQEHLQISGKFKILNLDNIPIRPVKNKKK